MWKGLFTAARLVNEPGCLTFITQNKAKEAIEKAKIKIIEHEHEHEQLIRRSSVDFAFCLEENLFLFSGLLQ